jgi:hypothetical protein
VIQINLFPLEITWLQVFCYTDGKQTKKLHMAYKKTILPLFSHILYQEWTLEAYDYKMKLQFGCFGQGHSWSINIMDGIWFWFSLCNKYKMTENIKNLCLYFHLKYENHTLKGILFLPDMSFQSWMLSVVNRNSPIGVKSRVLCSLLKRFLKNIRFIIGSHTYRWVGQMKIFKNKIWISVEHS